MSSENESMPVEPSQPSQSPPDRSAGLLDLSAIWRRKHYLLLSLVATLTAGFAYLQQARPIYEAKARLLVKAHNILGQDRTGRPDKNFLQTQAEIIRSPITLRHALASVDLSRVGISEEEQMPFLLDKLRVSPLVDTDVLKIGIRAPDSQLAAELIDAIVEGYRQHVAQIEHKQYLETARLLELQEKERQAELDSLKKQYQELRRQSPSIGQGREARDFHMATLRNLSDALNTARNRRLDLESRMKLTRGHRLDVTATRTSDQRSVYVAEDNVPSSQAGLVKQGNSPAADPRGRAAGSFDSSDFVVAEPKTSAVVGLIASPVDPARIELSLLRAETRASQLSQIYGARHPERRAVGNEITSLRTQLRRSRGLEFAAQAQELESVRDTERELTKLYDREIETAKRLEQGTLEEQQLFNSIEQAEAGHRAALTQLNDVKMADQFLAKGQTSTIIELLEGPDPSESKIWPRPISFLGVCAAIGMVSGCLLILLVENSRVSTTLATQPARR